MTQITTTLEEAKTLYEKFAPQVPAGFRLEGGELVEDDGESGINFQSPGYEPFPTNVQMGG